MNRLDLGIPNAFVVQIVVESNVSRVEAGSTDCTGKLNQNVQTSSPAFVDLYVINTVKVTFSESSVCINPSLLVIPLNYFLIHSEDILVNDHPVFSFARNGHAIIASETQAHVGVVAYHGDWGNAQFALMSFGLHTCSGVFNVSFDCMKILILVRTDLSQYGWF